MSNNEPSESLHTIAYVSRCALEGDTATIRHELERLLEVSRALNERDGITGILMMGRLCFAQILEGPHDDVERTFGRLEVDPRHDDIVVLTREALHARSFEHWAMARVDDESGLIDRFFARRGNDTIARPDIAVAEPLPPFHFLLDEIEHLVGSAGRASAASLFPRVPSGDRRHVVEG